MYRIDNLDTLLHATSIQQTKLLVITTVSRELGPRSNKTNNLWYHSRPIRAPTPTSRPAVEYGTNNFTTIGPPAPVPSDGATSPDLANVCVAAGRSVTVLVTVIGVPVIITLCGVVEAGPSDSGDGLATVVDALTV